MISSTFNKDDLTTSYKASVYGNTISKKEDINQILKLSETYLDVCKPFNEFSLMTLLFIYKYTIDNIRKNNFFSEIYNNFTDDEKKKCKDNTAHLIKILINLNKEVGTLFDEHKLYIRDLVNFELLESNIEINYILYIYPKIVSIPSYIHILEKKKLPMLKLNVDEISGKTTPSPSNFFKDLFKSKSDKGKSKRRRSKSRRRKSEKK